MIIDSAEAVIRMFNIESIIVVVVAFAFGSLLLMFFA